MSQTVYMYSITEVIMYRDVFVGYGDHPGMLEMLKDKAV
jgi:hypothetical protein